MKHKTEDYRVKVTKQVIRNALIQLMKAKSISEISVTEVSRLAEINRGSFYNHYSNTVEVLDEIKLKYLEDITNLFKSPTETQDDMRARFIKLCEIFRRSKDEALVVINNMTIDDFCKGSAKLYGASQKIADSNSRLSFSFYYSGMSAIIKQWLENEENTTTEEIGNLLYDLIVAKKSI